VPAGSTPQTTGWFGVNAWVSRSEALSSTSVDTVADLIAGQFPIGLVVTTKGYHVAGDGGGKTYYVRNRVGGYGQNGSVIIPCNADEAQAYPTDAVIDAAHAGILPSVASTDNTKRFNDLAAFALALGQKVINVPIGADYKCSGELTGLAQVTLVGNGRIVGDVANNHYKRIYPASSVNEQITVNNNNSAGLAKFTAAVKRFQEGGAKPVIVLVGDSLTQGGHRVADNFWWIRNLEKHIKERVTDCTVYNRGIAGSGIDQLDSIVQTATPINAPYEPQWNTIPNKLLRDYVSDLNPDLIVIAYGMNSGNAASASHAIVTARTNLKTVCPNADLVWLTTPIRTTDLTAQYAGVFFGTYPLNEHSNTAGLVTRHLAATWGEYCVDVNRMSSITHLGEDPVNFRMNRYAGQFKDPASTMSAPSKITVAGDASWTLNLSHGDSVGTLEMFRNVTVEFTVNAATVFSPDFRVSLRKDPSSVGELLFQFTASAVNLIGYKASSGVQASWAVAPAGKKFRIEAIGADVQVYIDDVLTAPTTGNSANFYGSMFLAPVKFIATSSTSLVLNNLIVTGATRYDYAQHIPTLTAFDAFNVAAGDGGNNLNHPNTLGEREMYAQPVAEFAGYLATVTKDQNTVYQTDITPAGSLGTIILSRYGNIVTLSFEDYSLAANTGTTPILNLSPELRPKTTASCTLSSVTADSNTRRVQVRAHGDVYIGQAGTGTGKFSGSVAFVV
jgi:hypothetical protein